MRTSRTLVLSVVSAVSVPIAALGLFGWYSAAAADTPTPTLKSACVHQGTRIVSKPRHGVCPAGSRLNVIGRGPQGPEGQQGPTGPAGPKGDKGDSGATNVRVISATTTMSDGLNPASVACPDGTVATGGGYWLGHENNNAAMSRPHVSSTGVPTGWEVAIFNDRGTQFVIVYAVCASS